MSNKITTQTLIEQLSASAGVSREIAENFVKAFANTVMEGVERDGVVKVGGIGTFKLVAVADRASVDVNTGQRIIIPGYNKLGFSADEKTVGILNGKDIDAQENKVVPIVKSKRKAKADDKTKAEKASGTKKTPKPARLNKEERHNEPVSNRTRKRKVEATEMKTEKTGTDTNQKVGAAVEESSKRAEGNNSKKADTIVTERVGVRKDEKKNVTLTVPTPESPVETKDKPTTVNSHTESKSIAKPAVTEKTSNDSRRGSEGENNNALMRFLFRLPWWGYVAIVAVAFLIILFVVLCINGTNNEDVQYNISDNQPGVLHQTVEQQDIQTSESPQKTTVATSKKEHILKYGETLTTISQMYYGTPDSMGAIWRLNKFEDPNAIPVGTRIKLP